MNYLFLVQAVFEMDNPKVFTNYVGIFKQYIMRIKQQFPDNKITIVMGEAASFCDIDIPGATVIVVTEKEMLNDGEFDRQEVLYAYFRYCHERRTPPKYLEYHCKLMEKKIALIPDVIITKDNAPYLEVLFPDALMLYTEVGFISRKPFPKTMQFDTVGQNCCSYLSAYWDQIESKITLSAEDCKMLCKLKNTIKNELRRVSPFEQTIKEYREKFKSIWLLPLQFSGFSNIDGEVQRKSQMDIVLFVLDRLPDDIGLIITTHPDFNILTSNVTWYLRRKYSNFIYDTSFVEYASSSQYLMGYIDGVINICSSVGLQTVFWDIPCIQIGDYFGRFMARRLGKHDVFGQLSNKEKERNNKILFWMVTRYIILPEYYNDPIWLQDYFENLKRVNEYPEIDTPRVLFEKHLQEIDVEGLPEKIKYEKEKKYYELYTKASAQYFRGDRFSSKITYDEILIYGKSSLAYILEMEIKENPDLRKKYKGIIDMKTYRSYEYNGKELIIVTPIVDYKLIYKDLREVFGGKIISIEELMT